MDTGLGAAGTLLRVHDNYYAGPAPGAPDPGPPPGTPRDTEAAGIADLIAARLAAREWAPGTVPPTQQALAGDHAAHPAVVSLALHHLAGQGTLTPRPPQFQPLRLPRPLRPPGPGPRTPRTGRRHPVRDDGTRTRHHCTPAP
jgi:hypothetical protein